MKESACSVQEMKGSIRGINKHFSSALESVDFVGATGIFKELDRTSAMTKVVLGPLEELQKITSRGFDVIPTLGTNELKSIVGAVNAFDDSLKIFKEREVGISLKPLLSCVTVPPGINEILGALSPIQTAIKAMEMPSISVANITRSFRGSSELQRIGSIVQNFPTFDDKTSDILRMSLGDWRSTISWPNGIFEDSTIRSSFYIRQGFNPALTEIPASAFQEGLNIARLRDRKLSESTDTDYRFIDEGGLQRNNRAYYQLQRFEIMVRCFIEKNMIAAFGINWVKQQVPGDILRCWKEKREKAVNAGEPERQLIEYADFTDYRTIIVRNDNWESIFKPLFKRKDFVMESFQRLYPIRISTMHSRIITQDDELFLRVETKRIFKAIGFYDVH